MVKLFLINDIINSNEDTYWFFEYDYEKDK